MLCFNTTWKSFCPKTFLLTCPCKLGVSWEPQKTFGSSSLGPNKKKIQNKVGPEIICLDTVEIV